MSDTNLNNYELDLTGTSPANLVTDESHTLVRQRNRVIALNNGAFYTESLVITHVETDYRLQPGIDFKILQTLYTASAASNKSVCGLILIHNGLLHQNLKITYQCVGGDYGLTSFELAKYLNNLPQTDPNYSWWNTLVEDQSNEIVPDKVDVFDFHYLQMCIEKIRNTILWANSPYDGRVRAELEKYLNAVEVQTEIMLNGYITDVFGNFLLEINKTFLGLGKVKNLGIASNTLMNEVIPQTSRITDFEENKYITLNSLQKFKDLVYARFATIKSTNISSVRGVIIPPSIADIVGMVNGAIFILKSKEYYTLENIGYDDRVYPPESEYADEYSILKINNNLHDRGGIYLFTERSGKRIFIAYHPNGNPANPFVWNKIIRDIDTEALSELIATHVADTNNPHGDDKESIGLDAVENLPVVTREEILSLQAVKKYMTMDALMLFFKTYMVDEKAAAADPRNDDEDKVMIIYTGQAEDKCLPPDCPCDDTPVPPPEPEPDPEPEPEPEPAPLMTKLAQYVNTIINEEAFIDPYNDIDDQTSKVNNSFEKFAMVGRYKYEGSTEEIEVLIKNNSYCAGYGDSYFTLASTEKAFIPISLLVQSNYNSVDNNGGIVNSNNNVSIFMYGQAQKEYIAVLKIPGKAPKFIRGIFEKKYNENSPDLPQSTPGINYGIATAVIDDHIPRFGYDGFGNYNTGSDAAQDGDTLNIEVRYLEDRAINDFEINFENPETDIYHTYAGSVNHRSYYNGTTQETTDIPPVLVHARLDSHESDQEGNIHGTLLLENLNNYGQMVMESNQLVFRFTSNLYCGIYLTNGSNSAKTVFGRLMGSSGTTGTLAMVNELGHYSYKYDFTLNVSEIEDFSGSLSNYEHFDSEGRKYYSVMFYIGYSLNDVELPHAAITPPMKITISNSDTYTEKSVPITMNGVDKGTVTLKRNNTTGLVSVSPYLPAEYINDVGLTGEALSCVYFLEKTVPIGQNPYVSLIDVYGDFNSIKKPPNQTVNQFINSYVDQDLGINYTELPEFTKDSQGTASADTYLVNVIKPHVRAYKLNELQKSTKLLTEYRGNLVVSPTDFSDISRVRMVTWNDLDFTCLLINPDVSVPPAPPFED